jgi:hypothetical protein
MLSNEAHQLMVRYPASAGAASLPLGPAGWGSLVYSFALGLINIFALSWLFARSPRHRWLAALMIAGQIVSRVLFTQQGISARPLAPAVQRSDHRLALRRVRRGPVRRPHLRPHWSWPTARPSRSSTWVCWRSMAGSASSI